MTWIKAARHGSPYPVDMSYAGEILGALAHTPDREMESLSLTELTDHIVALHHRYLREALPALEHYCQASQPELSQRFATFRAQLSRLLSRDEEILFPRLARLEEPGFAPNPARLAKILAWLSADHARLCARLRSLRARLRGAESPELRRLRRGLADLAEDLNARMLLQEQVLFPRAVSCARQVCGL
ncbi:MAG: hemerythrin domain-containing protein [Vulcanimicrobiota bacterium]